MHILKYYNSHILVACCAYLSIAMLAHLVPQQPGMVGVAEMCISHVE